MLHGCRHQIHWAIHKLDGGQKFVEPLLDFADGARADAVLLNELLEVGMDLADLGARNVLVDFNAAEVLRPHRRQCAACDVFLCHWPRAYCSMFLCPFPSPVTIKNC